MNSGAPEEEAVPVPPVAILPLSVNFNFCFGSSRMFYF
jgi:hypothetical protein